MLSVLFIFLIQPLTLGQNESGIYNFVNENPNEANQTLSLEQNETNEERNPNETILNKADEPTENQTAEFTEENQTALSNSKISNEIKDGKNKVIIKVKDKQKIKNIILEKRGKVEDNKDESLIFSEIDFDDLNYIAEDVDVEEIWPDRITQAVLDFSVNQIKAPSLWAEGFKGDRIKIAVLDTGINKNHPMLENSVVLERDFTGNNNPNDGNGHGTHVAGIISGSSLTGQYDGVAPNALILNGKILNDQGQGFLSWLIDGIDWAIDPDGDPSTDDQADVISLSLGATYSGEPEELLTAPEILKVKEAVNKGIVVVIASGNCASGCGSFYGVTTPGISPDAITVGSIDDNNEWASFSSGDTISAYIKPDLVAPGVSVCSSFLSDYACLSGTSMSTPHVAGSIALLLNKDNSLSPLQIKSILEQGALDLGESGKDVKYGSGLIDLSNVNLFEEGPLIGENYELVIPIFEAGYSDDIIFRFKEGKDKIKGSEVRVVLNLEEIGNDLIIEDTKKVSKNKFADFSFTWNPKLIGKHLLTIDVYDGDENILHLENVAFVGGGYVDNTLSATLVWGGV